MTAATRIMNTTHRRECVSFLDSAIYPLKLHPPHVTEVTLD